MYKLYQYNDNDFRIVINNDTFFKNDKTMNIIEQVGNVVTNSNIINNFKDSAFNLLMSNSFSYYFSLCVPSPNCDKFTLSVIYKRIIKFLPKKYFIMCRYYSNSSFYLVGFCDKISLYSYCNGFRSHFFDNFCDNYFVPIINYKKDISFVLSFISSNSVLDSNNNIFLYSHLNKPISYNIVPIDLSLFKSYTFNNNIYYDFSLSQLNRQQLLFLIYNIQVLRGWRL